MGGLINFLIGRTFLRPIARLIVGALAIPLFRVFMRRVIRLQNLDAELEKDLEQWFRGSLVLLVATRNMEESLLWWVPIQFLDEWDWVLMGLRVLLAIGVVEMMPDQELFAVIHPGPPKLKVSRAIWRDVWEKKWAICKGVICRHLDRSSAVFAILAAIAPGRVGWTCYGMALVQYLIIGLVTSKDKAVNVLSEFDRQVAIRRRELIDELGGDDEEMVIETPAKSSPESSASSSPAGTQPE